MASSRIPITQRERAFAFLKAKGMARLNELIGEGVTATTVSRLEREAAIVRLARGLYQLPDASMDAHHTLAEAAKLRVGMERHVIDGVEVPIFGVAKTIAYLFRYRRTVGINVALEGLREALRKRKATPAQIAKYASAAQVWKTMDRI